MFCVSRAACMNRGYRFALVRSFQLRVQIVIVDVHGGIGSIKLWVVGVSY